MKQSETVKSIQSLLSHHYCEIKRLQNSNEPFKYENINLLSIEYAQFKQELLKHG
jgi:hypothetical protein